MINKEQGAYLGVSITDFGIAIDLDAKETHQTSSGSPGFTAPEALSSQPEYSEKTDVFSVGSVLYFIFTRRRLFCGEGGS